MTPAILAAILVSLTLTALILATRPRAERDLGPEADDHGDGGRGGSDRTPRPPHAPAGEGEPTWWPQFERALAAYTREHAGARR